MSEDELIKKQIVIKRKIELAEVSNSLGRARLRAAIVQAVLTTINLCISLIILGHILLN